MYSKIFLSVLLLTCVYTYMLKSIKDNNYSNFQKLSDNFNFELNGIQDYLCIYNLISLFEFHLNQSKMAKIIQILEKILPAFPPIFDPVAH